MFAEKKKETLMIDFIFCLSVYLSVSVRADVDGKIEQSFYGEDVADYSFSLSLIIVRFSSE